MIFHKNANKNKFCPSKRFKIIGVAKLAMPKFAKKDTKNP